MVSVDVKPQPTNKETAIYYKSFFRTQSLRSTRPEVVQSTVCLENTKELIEVVMMVVVVVVVGGGGVGRRAVEGGGGDDVQCSVHHEIC